MPAVHKDVSRDDGIARLRADVRAAIKAGDLAAADRLLATIPDAWRKILDVQLLYGDRHEAAGDLADAAALYHTLRDAYPHNYWVSLRLAWTLQKLGQIPEARDVFERDIWPSEAALEIKQRLLAALAPDDDAFIDRLRAHGSEHPVLLIRSAAENARRGLLERALGQLETAARAAPLSRSARFLYVTLLMQAQRLDEALVMCRALVATDPNRADYARQLILLLYRNGLLEELCPVMQRALRRWPEDWFLLFRFNRLLVPHQIFAALFSTIEENRKRYAFNHRAQFQYALAALQAGQTAAAMDTLAAIPATSDIAHMSEPVKAALATRSAAMWLAESRLRDDDLSRTVQVVRADAAIVTLVLFTGIQGRFCYLPLSHIDAVLAICPVNVIYLRDPDNRAYLTGISGLGGSPPIAAAALQSLALELGGQPLVTMGASVGGFAAIRYGALAGAGAAISFAGPTVLTSLEDGPNQTHLYLGSPELRAFSARDLDIRPDVAGCPNMSVWHVSGAANAADARQADRLSGLPNVTLHHVSDVDDHHVALRMISSGTFETLVARAVAAATHPAMKAAP